MASPWNIPDAASSCSRAPCLCLACLSCHLFWLQPLSALPWGRSTLPCIAVYGLLYLLIFLLWGAALYRARRYQLSRTLWRGIRGTLVGSSMIYSLTYFGSMLARGMSLGWTTPVLNTVLQEQIIGDMRFGDLAFKFKGRAGPLYPTYALCWFLSLLALIVFAFVFGAEVAALFGPEVEKVFDEYFQTRLQANIRTDFDGQHGSWRFSAFPSWRCSWSFPCCGRFTRRRNLRPLPAYTRAGNATFKLNATAGSLISLVIVNLLILIFTLGIGRPFMQQRLIRYMCDRLEVVGTIDVHRIAQSQAALDRTGEGLADAFDLGVV